MSVIPTVGALLTTVTGDDVTAAPLAAPSDGVALRLSWSPSSPLPNTDRSSVAPVWPASGAPFFSHWYA